jgi:hypothetical protein
MAEWCLAIGCIAPRLRWRPPLYAGRQAVAMRRRGHERIANECVPLRILGRRRLQFLNDERSAAVGAEIYRSRLPFHGLYGVLCAHTLGNVEEASQGGSATVGGERRFADYLLQSGEAPRVSPYISMSAKGEPAGNCQEPKPDGRLRRGGF